MKAITPTVNLETIDNLVFVYDHEDDIAFIHMNGPRPAVSEQVDDGWYLRVDDGTAIGMELHGLKTVFLSSPFYSEMFRPSIKEIEAFTGRSFESASIIAEGSATQLRRTTDLMLLLLGQAVAKLQAVRLAEYEDLGRGLLTT